jgi:hypothetical protein
MLHYAGFSAADISAVAERPESDKIGTYMPGTSIPVVSEEVLFGIHQPDVALLFSWHLASTIIPKLRAREYWGTVLVPLPDVTNIHPPKTDRKIVL